MPVYQYACPDCGHQFERQQKFTDEKLKVCPNCHKRHIHRVVGQVSVAFRGSGFYVNDSRGSNPAGVKPKTPDSKPAEGAPSESTPAESKTETKAEAPEAKPDAKPESKSESKSESSAPATSDKKPAAGDAKK
ncbi:MAG: FmdB family transcriptional regulator [Anaerolineae bacterium]|nr:FmdB family transcriptional regulator [Anaerolineae bacterium]